MDRPFNDKSYSQFLNEGRIMGTKCKQCGALAMPPRPICINCHGNEMDWFEFQGTGKLSAFTAIVVAPPKMVQEGFGRHNPYIVGVVDLDEGVKAVVRIMDVDSKEPGQLKVGTSLEAKFLVKEEGGLKQTTLVFHP